MALTLLQFHYVDSSLDSTMNETFDASMHASNNRDEIHFAGYAPDCQPRRILEETGSGNRHAVLVAALPVRRC